MDKPTRCYSKLLGDYFSVFKNGSVVFDNGEKYSWHEIQFVKKLDDETKRKFHLIKKVFEA